MATYRKIISEEANYYINDISASRSVVIRLTSDTVEVAEGYEPGGEDIEYEEYNQVVSEVCDWIRTGEYPLHAPK